MKLHRRASQTVALEGVADVMDSRPQLEYRLELIGAGEEVRQARVRPREAHLLGLRVSGYSREQMAEFAGDFLRTVGRQLVRAQRKRQDPRRSEARVGSRP